MDGVGRALTELPMGIAFNLLVILFLVVSVALVLIILVQRPQGGGLAQAFGGSGGTDTAFGGRVGDALTYATATAFGIYLLLAIGLNIMSLRMTKGEPAPEPAAATAPAPTPVQLRKAEALARELVDLGPARPEPPWLGARPCTADMLPVIGAAPRHAGLWCNFGHAHQGFTLGPMSGRLLAELVSGEKPLVDPQPYAPARFA